MNKNLQWRVVTILVIFILFFGIGVYPILAQRFGLPAPAWLMAKQLRLGLDLKGGVHVVMRVHTDDALRLATNGTSEQLREALQNGGINVGAVTVTAPTAFRIEGVPQDRDAEFRRFADEHAGTNYDRNPGPGGTYEFTMKGVVERNLREQAMVQALDTIERRVNELGVAEPIIARHGEADQILVQLPGVTDVARAKEIIRSTAILELKLVEAGPASTRESLLEPYKGQVPPDMEIVTGAADPGSGDTGTVYFLVRKVAAVTGRDLRGAQPSLDEYNKPAVSFSLNSEGARKFGQVTGANIGRSLAIILDGRVQSYPRIDGRITNEGRISGNFTTQEVADLSLILRSGALPASMSYLEERVIGPSLGADSIRAGVTASLVGLALVGIFMLVYYRMSGINAILSVVVNLIILLGFMAYIGAVMTLPGIAGFILTIGMGVDSNVLIFERIKEELDGGKSVRAAVAAGFDRVFLTILDTHVASLIGAAILFNFGTGPIRGFATTLTFGLLANIFTAVFVSRTIFEAALSRRHTQTATLSI
jgi:preprotein translocase subunit SecD